jgi:hypothetical protein
MEVNQHVHAGVPSDYSAHWMFYYKRYMNTDVLQYAHADVPSDYSY